MLVTFCGHSELSERAAVREWLDHVLEKLISDGADTFYLGGYGAFDSLAAAVLREYKANCILRASAATNAPRSGRNAEAQRPPLI